MDLYTVYKGKHPFKLWGHLIPAPVIRRDVKAQSWTVRFDESCAYTLPGAEQRDWNKGGGVSFDLLTNHTDAAMWGWRWNPGTRRIEMTAYCHINGKRPFLQSSLYSKKRYLYSPNNDIDGEVCLECKIGDTIRISLQVDREESRYDYNFMVIGSNESWPVGVAFTHSKRWSRVIHPWFGGNAPAPHNMDLYLERK